MSRSSRNILVVKNMALLNKPLWGILLAITGFGLFSITDALSRIFAENGYSIFQIVATVQWVGLATLLCFRNKLGGIKNTLHSQNKKLHLLRALCLSISIPANVYAFATLPFALTYTLLFTQGLFLILLSGLITNEHMSWTKALVIITAMIGAITVLRPWAESFDWRMLIPIGSAVVAAVQNLIARRMGSQETPLSLAFYTMIGVGVVMTFVMLLRDDFVMPDVDTAVLFLLSGIMAGIATLCLPMAFRFARANLVAPMHYTQLIWAAIIGYFLFNEIPDIFTIVGGIIIMGAGLWTILAARKENR